MKAKLEFVHQIRIISERYTGDCSDIHFEALTEVQARKLIGLVNQMWAIVERRVKR